MSQHFVFEAFPGRSLRVALFSGVTNGSALQQLLLSGALQPETALLNAALVAGTFSLQLAAFKAVAAQAGSRLTTRTLHSELVFNLSPNSHISDSLRRFGVGEETRSLLVARFDGTEEELEAVCSHVVGTRRPLADLESLVDAAALQKLFKPTAEELAGGTLQEAIVSRIGIKSVA